MSITRIYVVHDTEDDFQYLVRASSVAQAIAHISRRFNAKVATQEQLVDLMSREVEVETYKPARQIDLL